MRNIEQKRLERIRAILISRKNEMNPKYWNEQWQKLIRAEAELLKGGTR